jgi:hypothetical protein
MSLMTPKSKFIHDCRLAGWSPSELMAALSPAPQAPAPQAAPPADSRLIAGKNNNLPVSDVKLFNLEIYESAEKSMVASYYEASPISLSSSDDCSIIEQLEAQFETTLKLDPPSREGPPDSDKENTPLVDNVHLPTAVSESGCGRFKNTESMQALSHSCESYPQGVVTSILEAPIANGWKLFKHQKEAILKCLELNRIILAYDMGLGKTLIGEHCPCIML